MDRNGNAWRPPAQQHRGAPAQLGPGQQQQRQPGPPARQRSAPPQRRGPAPAQQQRRQQPLPGRMKDGVISLKGVRYATVAARVDHFRKDAKYQGWALVTEMVSGAPIGDSWVFVARAIDPNGRVISTGWGKRKVGDKQGKGLQFAETNAIGRCLANLGIDTNAEYLATEDIDQAVEIMQRLPREDRG